MGANPVKLADVTQTDYMAWIALLWTVLYFAVAVLMIVMKYSVNDILAITAVYGIPVGMIIAFYFKSRT